MKRTKKYIAAEIIANKLGVSIDKNIYLKLQENNYFWDSDKGEWFLGQEAEPATELVKIRVWADRAKIDRDCLAIIASLEEFDFALEEKSEPYLCRPPKQNEARIYLTFRRK